MLFFSIHLFILYIPTKFVIEIINAKKAAIKFITPIKQNPSVQIEAFIK